MTQQYLAGELSFRLEQLQAAAGRADRRDVVGQLRREVEARPLTRLAPALVRALDVADALCWDCVDAGDAVAFTRLAGIAGESRRFGVCAGLLPES